MRSLKKALLLSIAAVLSVGVLSGCEGGNTPKLNPKQPVTVTLWHYYNGAQKNALDRMIDEFNETIGLKKGIIVEGHNQGDISQLEQSVKASIAKEVGSKELPNIFASYADTAYSVEKMGILANLDEYFTEEEQAEYVTSYIEEGRIGANGELKIFPMAKSTEVFMLNKTDWEIFAKETGASLDSLATMEGVAAVAESYYNWTDASTPVPGDGKAFFGRDAMANLFVIGCKQLGTEIFQVENQKVTINIDETAMRRIWDSYYVPYIKGYFGSFGRFRSDDTKVGEIISLVGSTSSASYFPSEVTKNDQTYPIEALVLPAPVFEGGEKFAVQQGAGMAVTKNDPAKEYASVTFLKWFTEKDRNVAFSSSSGYLPVKVEANDFQLLRTTVESAGETLQPKVELTLDVAFDVFKTHKLYTNKAFDNGSDARKVLEYNLQDLAVKDRETVKTAVAGGQSLEEAAAPFTADEHFQEWLEGFKKALNSAESGGGKKA